MAITGSSPPPSHDSKEGRGGWREVATDQELQDIDPELIRDGMAVAVIATNVVWYRKNGQWVGLLDLDRDLSARVAELEAKQALVLSREQLEELIREIVGSGGGGGTITFLTTESGFVMTSEGGTKLRSEGSQAV